MRNLSQVILINSCVLGFSALDIKEILQIILLILSVIYTIVKTIKDFKNN